MEILCELYEAQVACGRYIVHELTSEVNSRMKCVAKIMAMPGTRTAVTDLCMLGLVACDDGGPRFVNASVRTVTNARRVGVRLQSKCASTHRHARVNADDPTEKGEQTGSWVRQVAQAMEEQVKEDQQELETREKKGGWKVRRGYAGHVQNEMGKLKHHDEQELLSICEGWHWDDNKGGWLDPELCAKARREEVEPT